LGTICLYALQQQGSSVSSILFTSPFTIPRDDIPTDETFESISSFTTTESLWSLLDLPNRDIWEMFALSFVTSVFVTLIASLIAFTPCPKRHTTTSLDLPASENAVAKGSGYYASRIDREEFDRQRADYTMDQIRLLQKTPEFKSALERKGYDEQAWNWQVREVKSTFLEAE
jgi:hypothetical protein